MATRLFYEKVVQVDALDISLRERQIEEIRKDLLTVRDLFIQMEELVERQGPNIISIEQNISNIDQNVIAATENIQDVYNKKWRCTIL